MERFRGNRRHVVKVVVKVYRGAALAHPYHQPLIVRIDEMRLDALNLVYVS